MNELVMVCTYAIRDRKKVRFHKSGKYIPDHPEYNSMAFWTSFEPTKTWEDKDSYNNGWLFSKCGIRMNQNPFGIGKNNIRTPKYIPMRRDHANKFANACKRCFV